MTRVKTCFALDITASMEPWIQAAKNKIRSIVQSLPADTKVAFVGYRDYNDTQRFVIQNFCDVNELLIAIADVHADGGEDIAEDVAGGLEKVQQLDWTDADVKTLIHIADAPPHGHNYHDACVSDMYPNDDQNIGHRIRELAESGIDYTFIRIKSITDTMILRFAHLYKNTPGQFKVIDLAQQGYRREQALAAEITRSLTLSIERYNDSQDPELP